ncbi:GNAT family N-acetyltransferase [Pseudomonas sp. BW16M2]|uniref:GNAT family N-acetyltransferase n=1 Tax=Pseudomonas sp. BW16M2 TaxID=2745489 RepID=UPI001645009A|nr:GNAT family N-acetyltransferase [Pseudomonas sp. BW16M2]
MTDTLDMGGQLADAGHVGQVVPLVASIAPQPLAFIYGTRHLEPYLAHAFARNLGWFGHARHRVLVQAGECQGVVATLGAREKTRFDLALLTSILRFYPGLSGLRVIRRLQRSVARHPRPGHDALWLYNLAVAPQARGRGFGTRLLRGAIARARAAGHGRLQLDVDADNQLAQRLYRAHGFQVDSEIPGVCCDGFLFADQLRMSLDLGDRG